MPHTQEINIALCFSNPLEAKNFSQRLGEISPKVNFVIGKNFDDFLKSIARLPKIDCFVIEETFKECSAEDLVDKLKKSQRYKKAVMSVYTSNLKTVNHKFLELGVDYIFDLMSSFDEVICHLKKAIYKKLTPVIPKDFNVMVLDNNPEILELISIHLGELGHAKFDLCKGIQEAKINLVDKDYDMLLLDWNLDDGTCIDLIEFIKTSTIRPRTKSALTVVITGRDDVDDIMTLLRYGIKDHIIKPFDFNEFEDKITYALDKHLKRG